MNYKAFLIIAIISAAFYASSINNDFQYDDVVYVTENQHIRYMKNIPAFFTHPEYLTSLGHKAHYRPLVAVSYALNYAIGGLNPAGYHVVNLLFHIGNAYLLFLIVQTMIGSRRDRVDRPVGTDVGTSVGTDVDVGTDLQVCPQSMDRPEGLSLRLSLQDVASYIALASALIFAVHPFNSEAVNYITARSSLMSGFFYLLSFYCWVKFRSHSRRRRDRPSGLSAGGGQTLRAVPTGILDRPVGADVETAVDVGTDLQVCPQSMDRPSGLSLQMSLRDVASYIASLLAFILGLLTKEVVITLPAVLWLYDLYGFSRNSSRRTLLNWRAYLPYLPFLLIMAVPIIARGIYSGRVIPHFKRDVASQIYTVIPVLARYLKLLFLPTGLTIVHDVEIYKSLLYLPVILSAGILLLLVLNAVYLFLMEGVVWRLLSFFMIWFFVTLLPIIIFPLNRIMQENRGYISGIGFAILIGILLGRLMDNSQRSRLAYGLLVILIVLYGTGTVYRNTVWKDGVTLWTDAMEKSPYEPLTYNNLSVAYKRRGDYEGAKEVLYRGIRLSPGEWLLHYNLGNVYTGTGELDLALNEYDRAMRLNPSMPMVYNSMGYVRLLRGEVKEAINLIHVAIDKKKDYAPAHYNMAKALEKAGHLKDSRRELEVALHYATLSNSRKLIDNITRYMQKRGDEGEGIEDIAEEAVFE